MNYDRLIKNKLQQVAAMQAELTDIVKNMKKAADFTVNFLEICKRHRIDKVAIAVAHESIPRSTEFPFGYTGSIFTQDARTKDGWPSIWRVVEEAGISGGCGNTDQHSANTAKLIDGCYHLKNGKWNKVD